MFLITGIIAIQSVTMLPMEKNSVRDYFVQEGDRYAWKCVQMDVITPGCGYYYFPPDWRISESEYLQTELGDCIILDIKEINESIWVKTFLWQDGTLFKDYHIALQHSGALIQPLHLNWTVWIQSYYSSNQEFILLWDNETDYGAKVRFGNATHGDIHELHFSKLTGLLKYVNAGSINSIPDEHGFYNHSMILLPRVPKIEEGSGFLAVSTFFSIVLIILVKLSKKERKRRQF